jgi:catechol 2,3-dioxygenase-like lactoylglutathione lyase family enzyme
MDTNGSSTEASPEWAGIHHLALVTDDMDATVRFYHGVLGAELVATIGNEAFRHYFFRLGDGQTVAFFEYRDQPVEHFAKPAGIPDARASQFDHLSLALADEAALEELRERLSAHDCEVTEVVDHDIMRSIYFTDPNGIALEASWWTLDATAVAADHSDKRLFGDEDPVPAVAEIAAGGLRSTPDTKLVDEPTPSGVG